MAEETRPEAGQSPEPVAPPPSEPEATPAPEASPEMSVEERLRSASAAALRARRRRIDALLEELARPIGGAALATEGVDTCGVLELDRILRKIDRVDREVQTLARAARKPEGIIESISQDLSRLADALAVRDLRAKREQRVAELGLALLAADPRELDLKAPVLAVLARRHADDARRVDELFRQAGLVDEELGRRARDGRLAAEPKELDRLVGAAGEAMSSATDKAKAKLKDLGKSAAKAAARRGSRAMLGLAKSALGLGSKVREEEDEDDDEAPPPRSRSNEKRDVPTLIRELGRLRDEGLLSPEEFERKKRDLLERL